MISLYSRFYRLQEDPFSLTPDPKFFYSSDVYQEALMGVIYGVSQRRGIIVLTGEAGVGKTTILYKVKESLASSVKVVFLPSPHATFSEILEYILHELQIRSETNKLSMLRRLREFLIQELECGNNVALFIDEAQSADLQELEDIRLLSNLQTPEAKLLQIVFAGQPEFLERLDSPRLLSLRQRIAVHCRVQPLGLKEVGNYIRVRLEVAGVTDPEFFSDDAVAVIAQRSLGIPRLINLACDQALLTAYSLGQQQVDGAIMREALADVLPNPSQVAAATMHSPQNEKLQNPSPSSLHDGPIGEEEMTYKKQLSSFSHASSKVLKKWFSCFSKLNTNGKSSMFAVHTPFTLNLWEGERSVFRHSAKLVLTVAVLVVVVGASVYLTSGQTLIRLDHKNDIEVHASRTMEGAVMAAAGELGAGMSRDISASPPPPERQSDKSAERVGKVLALLGEVQNVAVPRVAAPLNEITVQSGDTLARLAVEKYGYVTLTVLDLLRIANPEVLNIHRLQIGQRLLLPDLHGTIRVFAEKDGSYSYLLLSTPSKREALYYRNMLAKKGQTSKVAPVAMGPGRIYYRVLIGGFRGEQAAAAGGAPLARVVVRDLR